MVCNAAVNPFFGSSLDIPDDAFDKTGANMLNSNTSANINNIKYKASGGPHST